MKKQYSTLSIIPVFIQSEANYLLADSGTPALGIAPINAVVDDFDIATGFDSNGFKDASFGDGEISFM